MGFPLQILYKRSRLQKFDINRTVKTNLPFPTSTQNISYHFVRNCFIKKNKLAYRIIMFFQPTLWTFVGKPAKIYCNEYFRKGDCYDTRSPTLPYFIETPILSSCILNVYFILQIITFCCFRKKNTNGSHIIIIISQRT